MVDVTQADRGAAADSVLERLRQGHGGLMQWMVDATDSMRRGEQDGHWEIQAFARHREAAIAEAIAAKDARIAELDAEVVRLCEAICCVAEAREVQDFENLLSAISDAENEAIISAGKRASAVLTGDKHE